jgi:formylmethanofuran dehydrogenase subunit D
MSVLKYKDPLTGEWKIASTLKIVEHTVDGGGSADVFPPEDVPDYVKEEAEAVAEAVRSVQTGKTLTFAAMADTHLGMALTTTNADKTRASALMAGQGLAYLRYILPIHASYVLGDLSWSDNVYSVQQVKDDWQGTTDRLSVGMEGLPSAWTAGNHDINYGIGRERTMTEAEIEKYIGANRVGMIHPDGKCYGYMDFPIQKIRVIVLNTADSLEEKPVTDTTVKAESEFMGETQLQWFADVALNFSDKSNPAEWGIVICSHHSIAYSYRKGIAKALQILEAYRDSQSGSITYTSDKEHTVTYDFTSGAKAEIICNVHGHSHNFVYKKRSSTETTDGSVEPWLWCICVPCINCGRENEQATNADLKDKYGDFDASGNPVYYRKTKDTRNGTSFCIFTIDRDTKRVYAHKFGAGVDRIVNYDKEDVIVTYSVTSNLTNCGISNATSSVVEGASYSATVTANSGYALDSVTVTMGGVDITSTVYSGGKITIASVTGDIVITAKATEEIAYPPTSDKWTNLVLTAKSSVGGTDIYNGVGYMNGKYISGNSYGNDASTTATGYIAYEMTKTSAPTIYVKGISLDYSANSHIRMYFVKTDGTNAEYNMIYDPSGYMDMEVLDASAKYYKFTLANTNGGNIDTVDNFGLFVAFRLSGVGSGANLIVTLDEPIV